MATSVARISRQKARKREGTKPAPTTKRNLRNSTPARLNKKEEIKVNFSNNNSPQLINLINLKNKKEENLNNYLIGHCSGGFGRNFDKEKREEDKLTNDNNLFILNNTPHFIFKPNYSAIRQRRISQMENRSRIRVEKLFLIFFLLISF